MSHFVEQLMEMGFSKTHSEKALAATGNAGVAPAMEWILTNPEEQEPTISQDNNTSSSSSSSSSSSINNNTEETPMNVETQSQEPEVVVHNALCDKCKEQIVGIRYKCAECKDFDLCPSCYEMRLVYHDPDHVFESHEKDIPQPDRRPLTEEEKKEALARLEQKRIELKKKKEEEEARLEREREIQRRKAGKEALEAKRQWDELQKQKELEARQKEKLEDKKARAAIREKIARDKAARANKFNTTEKAPLTSPLSNSTPSTSTTTQNYDQCAIQVRLTNGSTIQETFQPSDTLRSVHNWVTRARTDGSGPFILMMTYPRKEFVGSALDNTTLKDADLVPRGALMIRKEN